MIAKQCSLGIGKMMPLMLMLGWGGCAALMPAKTPQAVTTSVTVPPPQLDSQGKPSANVFVSLLNQAHPGNRVGYRLFEYEPIARGAIPAPGGMAAETAKAERLEAEYAARPGVFKIRIDVHGLRNWAPMIWTYYIVPTGDGYDMLWLVATEDQGLNEYYIAQQCLRFSGVHNSVWRRSLAEAPAFSEYDLWKKQGEANQGKTSLSFVWRQGKWEAIPPAEVCTVCPTPLGSTMEAAFAGPDMKSAFARAGQPSDFAGAIDCGLIARGDAGQQWLFAMYWDRTTHVSNHHPADCLHSYVNLGPIPPRGQRAIEGKLYWLKASKDSLHARWLKDQR